MALKLPYTRFPLPIFLPFPSPQCGIFTCACAPAATSSGKRRGQTQTPPLSPTRAVPSRSIRCRHCFLSPAPLVLSACPQGEHPASPKLVVSSWSPAWPQHTGHRRQDCQSQRCRCSAEVSEGDRWASDGFQRARPVQAQSTLKSPTGLGWCNAPGVHSLQSPRQLAWRVIPTSTGPAPWRDPVTQQVTPGGLLRPVGESKTSFLPFFCLVFFFFFFFSHVEFTDFF